MASLQLYDLSTLRVVKRQERLVRAGTMLVGQLSLTGGFGVASLGRLIYNSVVTPRKGIGVLTIGDDRLCYEMKDERAKIDFSAIQAAEFHFYDDNAEGWDDGYPGPTLHVHHNDSVTTSYTLDSRKNCVSFLKELYATGIPLRDYTNGRRSYLLKHRLYKEIQELKIKYGPDFW